MRKRVGLILTPGCRLTELVGVQAILGLYALKFQTLWLAADKAPVHGETGLGLLPDQRFEDVKDLDICVVGHMAPDVLDDDQTIAAIGKLASRSRHILALSNGVLALAKAGCLEGKTVTSDRQSSAELQAHDLRVVEATTFIQDGNLYTAGPSTGALEGAFALLRLYAGDAIAKGVELNLEYHPSVQFPTVTAEAPPAQDGPGLNIGVFMAPDMYLPDVVGAMAVFQALPQVQFHYLWKAAGPVKSALGPRVMADTAFKDCPDLDVLIVGFNHPKLCADAEVLAFIKGQHPRTKAFICVCAGSLLVGATGIAKGKAITSNFHMTSLLSECDVEPAHTQLKISPPFYSAGPAVGAYEAALWAVADLHGPEVAAFIEQDHLEYQPNPPFGMGSPERASRGLLAVSKMLSAPLLPAYRRSLRRGYAQGHARS